MFNGVAEKAVAMSNNFYGKLTTGIEEWQKILLNVFNSRKTGTTKKRSFKLLHNISVSFLNLDFSTFCHFRSINVFTFLELQFIYKAI